MGAIQHIGSKIVTSDRQPLANRDQRLFNDDGIHGHRPWTTIDDAERVLPGTKVSRLMDQLLGLARTRGGQIHGCLDFAVNLTHP